MNEKLLLKFISDIFNDLIKTNNLVFSDSIKEKYPELFKEKEEIYIPLNK